VRIRFRREVCGDLAVAEQREWLLTHGLGGYAPFSPRGCIAQAWSVAELLRAWTSVQHGGF
jgi:Amylo-alpha-1,6-glucosidase